MKSKYKLPDFILWIILGLIISVVIYILGYSPQEEFTIYKNECENKTLYDFEIRVYDRDCVEIQEVESRNEHFIFYKPQTSQLFCDNYEDYGIGYDFGMRVISQKYNYIKTEQVCNQIEVDEIEYINEILAFDSECKRNCWDKYSGQWNSSLWNNCDEKCYWSILRDKSISKKDITKEWLDGNCKCKNIEGKNGIIEEADTSWDTSKMGTYKCLKYKCFSDYFVEVN